MIDEKFLPSCEKYDPTMTAEEYCEAIERYMRMIWDDSKFPEKELKERQASLLESYNSRTPVDKAADEFINQIQEENADPVVEAVIDELFRREAEQKGMLKKRRRGKR